MTKRQQKILDMHQVLISLFEKSKDVWSPVSAVDESYTQFKSMANELRNITLLQQKQSTKWYTVKKNEDKEQLINQTYKLSLKVRSYAKIYQNTVLGGSAKITLSGLRRLSIQELINQALIIHANANDIKTNTPTFVITSEDLENMMTMINSLNSTSTERAEVSDKRSLTTDELDLVFKNTGEQIALLDDLVESSIPDKTFVLAYRQARKIDNTSGRKRVKDVEDKPEEGKTDQDLD